MKKVIHKIGFIFLSMLLAIQSCSDKIIEDDPLGTVTGGDKMVPIALDIEGIISANTYGPDYGNEVDVPGSAVENAVNDIVVYIFDNTFTCEKILHGVTAPVGPEMIKIRVKHFIAVVNAQANIPALFPLPLTNPSSVSYPALRKMLSEAKTQLPASPFLMVGQKLGVTITDQMGAINPYRVTIDVERAVAKITISFTKSGLALLHNITLQEVIMYKGANKIYLLDKPDSDDIIYGLSTTKNSFIPSGVVNNSPSYNYLADTIYTYASASGPDTTKAVRFEIKAAINSPTNIRTAKFILGEYERSSGDTVYDIRRNYWYDVKVNAKDPGMDSIYVTVSASPDRKSVV